MTVDDAARLIGPAFRPEPTPRTWADLGCGDGTFTRALATLLPAGSVVHAMDRDASAIRAMPSAIGRVTIRIHVGDFTVPPWPFTSLDGVLLANSLHYIPEPVGFVRHAAASMGHPRFVVVEYDTDNSNRWIPYPLSRKSLTRVFNEVGLTSPRLLGTRRSALRRGLLYAVAIV